LVKLVIFDNFTTLWTASVTRTWQEQMALTLVLKLKQAGIAAIQGRQIPGPAR
jgi:hypothetical protein